MRALFDVARLERDFRIYDSRADALGAMSAGQADIASS
jgi:hypothetical protein